MPAPVCHTSQTVKCAALRVLLGRASCCWCPDAFVVVWGFCVSGVTFNFSKHLPILGYGVRALQNLYLPAQADKGENGSGNGKQQSNVKLTQLIKERCAHGHTQACMHASSALVRWQCNQLGTATRASLPGGYVWVTSDQRYPAGSGMEALA